MVNINAITLRLDLGLIEIEFEVVWQLGPNCQLGPLEAMSYRGTNILTKLVY
jgi:hypothetical protein